MADRLRHLRASAMRAPSASQEFRAQALVQVEGLIRDAATLPHLTFTLASDLRPVLAFDTGYVFRARRSGRMRLAARSDLGAVPSDTPFALAFSRLLGKLICTHPGSSGRAGRFRPEAFLDRETDAVDFGIQRRAYALWIPLHDRKRNRLAAVVLLRAEPWSDDDVVVAARIASTASHAWLALSGFRINWPRRLPRRALWLAASALIVTSLMPVPIRVLAPYEIVATKPVLVTAPIAGVVEDVAVRPNTRVNEGELLFRFEPTEFRAAARIAERRLVVASVKRRRLEQSAIGDGEAKRALAAARAEEQLARAERDLARSRLARIEVRASRSGTVLFASADDWQGRPLRVGERVMQIADARQVEARVDLPVAESIVRAAGLDVVLFPNAEPLSTLAGTVSRAGHIAEPTSDGVLAYALTVTLVLRDDADPPPIGDRGIVQIFGPRTPLIVAVLRRPIRAVRQFFGL